MMKTRRIGGRGRRPAWLALGGSAAAVAMAFGAGIGTAGAAANPSAFFALGVLTVVGSNDGDTITIGRDPGGAIIVNGGKVPIVGGSATAANTRTITVLGIGGNDQLTIDETGGAMPKALMIGGAGDDIVTGGSGADLLIGQSGNDSLFAAGGDDRMFGGADRDILVGGDADDQAFGEAGDDLMIWNPGEDTDLNEGGDGFDTTEVNGGTGAESFTTTANGARVRFDRVSPAPFSIDIGTTEQLSLNAGDGDDTHGATGNLATLIALKIDGDGGNDTILGGNGVDIMEGGDGTDFLDGQQGNDVAFLGDGDDTFQWDPGDGSDVVEGQSGADSLLFNGADAGEEFDVAANGSRVRFFRNLGNIVMDLDDVERVDLNALGGTDNFVVDDVSGTDLTTIDTDLSNPADSGTADGAADTVTVNATNGDDVVVATGAAGTMEIAGLAARVDVTGAGPTEDRVSILGLAGDDVVEASGVDVGTAMLTIDGGANDDVLIGGSGDDTIFGGEGDDVLLGGPGTDTLDGGPGDNILIDGEIIINGLVADETWLAENTRQAGDETLVEHAGKEHLVPEADLTVMVDGVTGIDQTEAAESTEVTEEAAVVAPVSADTTAEAQAEPTS